VIVQSVNPAGQVNVISFARLSVGLLPAALMP
jgi:hypothetical protein